MRINPSRPESSGYAFSLWLRTYDYRTDRDNSEQLPSLVRVFAGPTRQRVGFARHCFSLHITTLQATASIRWSVFSKTPFCIFSDWLKC